MKTKQWLFTALTALLLAGCSTETDLALPDGDVNPPVPQGTTRLSFEIKGVRTGTSYATAALTPDESQLKDMVVILFPQDASGEPLPGDVATAVLRAKTGGKTAQGAPTAAVLIDKSVAEGTYYAVIMANLSSYYQGNLDINADEQFSAFVTLVKGKTYGTLFTGNSVNGDKLTYMSYSEYASVADHGLAMKALTTGIKVAAEADRGDNIALAATMKRPMARFDIKNSAWQSFTITGYRAMNVRENADICPSGNEVPDWSDAPVSEGREEFYSQERSNQLNIPSDHDNDPLTPAAMAYTPAFYLCPGVASDKSAVQIFGELEVGGKIMPLTLTLPLVTGAPPATTPIAITANKRYKIELTLSQGNDDVVGSVVLDEGSWDEGDGAGGGGGDNIEQKLPGEILDPSAGTTYANVDATNGTFTAPEGATEFSFRLVATANTIQLADGVDAGIITGVTGAATLAPSTTYTVQMAATGTVGKLVEMGKDKDGKPVTVKTYTVNREEKIDHSIYPPTQTNATLVDGIYWAPVNVGATTAGEQGLLFQFGRMKGWTNAQAMKDAKDTNPISIADADKDPDKCYLASGRNMCNWWIDAETSENIAALIARWSAVSDGSSNPCPNGWRLPTETEFKALDPDNNAFVIDDTNKLLTAKGVVLPYLGYFMSEYGGSPGSYGAYWLAEAYTGTVIGSIGLGTSQYINSAEGNSIRCVKTAPTN